MPGPLQQSRPPQAHQAPATTILPVGRRCSSQACSGSPSCWPGRGLPAWPPCAGGPAGVIWPASGGNRPHPCCPSAPKAGGEGWYTSSTGGYAGAPWLGELVAHQARFIMRWPTRYHLADGKGERPAWHITRGKRSQDHREIWDLNRRQYRKTGIVAVKVRHPQADELWRVAGSRPGKGRTPWYLLTNEPVATPDDAWRVVMAYARRWQVEMCYRLQDGPGHGEPAALVLGKPAQAAADGQSTPSCIPVGAGAGVPSRMPQNRRAVPPSRDTALQTKEAPFGWPDDSCLVFLVC